jgi:hypothetical protein
MCVWCDDGNRGHTSKRHYFHRWADSISRVHKRNDDDKTTNRIGFAFCSPDVMRYAVGFHPAIVGKQ